MLEHLGLAAAIEELCASFAGAIEVTVHTPDGLNKFGEETALCLYRVAQEALRNMAMHSAAKKAQVIVDLDEAEVVLSIADDGRGFDARESRGEGIGLVTLDERVRALDGTFTVMARPGAGTELRVRLPIRRRSPSAAGASPGDYENPALRQMPLASTGAMRPN